MNVESTGERLRTRSFEVGKEPQRCVDPGVARLVRAVNSAAEAEVTRKTALDSKDNRRTASRRGGEDPAAGTWAEGVGPRSADVAPVSLESGVTASPHADLERLALCTSAVAESERSLLCVLDREGRILFANQAWRQGVGKGGPNPGLADVGGNYLEECARAAKDDVTAVESYLRVQDVLAGRLREFSLDYPCRIGEKTAWFQMSVRRAQGPLAAAVVRHSDITASKLLEAASERESHYDRLTGLPNETYFREMLISMGRDCPERFQGMAIFHVGIDDYDMLVHGYGRAAARAVEVAVSQRLKNLDQKKVALGALTRGEFLVALHCDSCLPETHSMAHRLRALTAPPVPFGGFNVYMRTSVGVALMGPQVVDEIAVERGLQAAEMALLAARRGTGSSARIYDDAMAESHRRMAAHHAIARKALDRKEFVLYFQPIVGGSSRFPVAFETLLRRRLEDGSVESMQEVFGDLERSSTIIEIDQWVIENVCRQWVSWRQEHGSRWPVATISVNVSAFHFQQAEFLTWLRATLDRMGMPPQSLALEITERAYVDDESAFVRSIRGVAGMGVSLWVDDFGTGYSSLQTLRRGFASMLKMDRAMAAPETYDRRTKAMIAAVVSLARGLGVGTIGEGVETPEQAEELDRLGCDLQQGFLHARPMAAADIESWLLAMADKRPAQDAPSAGVSGATRAS
ncbi:MAG: EAL domain-containing protein [Acidobacteria bacterium]|nr:EAL domain-containing protein [Acidobacteriota bacterium]